MKKLTVLLLALSLVLPLGAKYSPSFTLSGGIESLDLRYHSMRTRLDVSLVSWKTGAVKLSLPLSVSYVTKSQSVKGLLSPQHYKNGVGAEVMVSGRRFGGSASVFYGYEHFTDENAMMRYVEFGLSPVVLLEKHISLSFPLSYTYTPEGREYSISLAFIIGGEI